MATDLKLNHPWLVAVWPGMGQVAISAGYYLMAKLGMHQFAELSARELFDVEHIEVKDGVIRPAALPRSRLFVWKDPAQARDIVVFIGEAQPPLGKYAFCRRLVEYARELAVERVVTFAAMATQMHPEHVSRVFGAATDEEGVTEIRRMELEVLREGHIGGLNGVLLGVAAEVGLPGLCLLGEIPHIFAHLPFPKASHAVLVAFSSFADIEIDLTELDEQAQAMNQKLGDLLAEIEKAIERRMSGDEETFASEPVEFTSEPAEEERISPADQRRIERLFKEAELDRSKAYELKRELDRLDAFKEYEDRFLDLFQGPA
jgi:proteasome assembly chaperone (PAC2) family protein